MKAEELIVKYDTWESHPEIKCPYCRAGWGGVGGKLWKDKFTHIDIFFSSEAGLQKECLDQEFIKGQIKSTDSYGNPTFVDGFKEKLQSLHEAFLNDPSDYTNRTITKDAFAVLLIESLNYGADWLTETQSENIRRPQTYGEVYELYERGLSIKEAINSLTGNELSLKEENQLKK